MQALVDALHDPSGNLRACAVGILADIGADAAPAIPALIDDCKRVAEEGAVGFRGVGAFGAVLGELGPAGREALAEQIGPYRDAILQELTPPIGEQAASAALALAMSRPPLDQAVPALKEMLASEDVLVRASAAQALLVLESSPDLALPVLKDALNCPCREVWAETIVGLERLGSAARPAAPLVAAALDGQARTRVQCANQTAG